MCPAEERDSFCQVRTVRLTFVLTNSRDAADHLLYIQYAIEFSAGRPDQNNMTVLRGRCILSGKRLLRHLLRLPKLWQRSV